MDPKTENANTQQQKQQPGGIGQAINLANRFARRGIPNPLGKVGAKIGQQVITKGVTAFLASAGPWILGAVGIAALFLIVFVLVGFVLPPPSETTTQPAISPTPTQEVTPSPAAP